MMMIWIGACCRTNLHPLCGDGGGGARGRKTCLCDCCYRMCWCCGGVCVVLVVCLFECNRRCELQERMFRGDWDTGCGPQERPGHQM